MKCWMVAVGVEMCDCGESFLGARDGRIFCQRRRPGKRWKLPKIRVCQLDSGVLVGSYKYLSLILILDQYYALDIKNGQNV